jgi:release factor glutamine methyltransferase
MAVKIQTIKDIRFYLAKELSGIYNEPEIRTIADLLIKTATGLIKLHQLYDSGYLLSDNEIRKILTFSDELKTGKPVQYVLGETDFYNCKIRLNSSTLIPRPETEELVDLIIKENKGYSGSIIDFGTGSGCIAIALAANLPLALVTGVDISDDAIKIASENAELNNTVISFIAGDILDFDITRLPRAGIIVSNPPYVRESEKHMMAKNVLDFEPHRALFVKDSDPLLYYKAIIKLAVKALLPGGSLYFEINEAMGIPLTILLKENNYSAIEIVLDINDRQRIIKSRKNGRE